MSEATAIQAILETCRNRDILLSISGENLSVDAPESALTPDLLDGLRQHKASLLTMLRRSEGESGPAAPSPSHSGLSTTAFPLTPADMEIVPWEECVEPREPCRACGSLVLWWDFFGNLHCTACDPGKSLFEKSSKLLGKASALRAKAREMSRSRP